MKRVGWFYLAYLARSLPLDRPALGLRPRGGFVSRAFGPPATRISCIDAASLIGPVELQANRPLLGTNKAPCINIQTVPTPVSYTHLTMPTILLV